MRLSPETCRVKPLRRIKTQLLHLVGLISLLFSVSLIRLFLVNYLWSENDNIRSSDDTETNNRMVTSKEDGKIFESIQLRPGLKY